MDVRFYQKVFILFKFIFLYFKTTTEKQIYPVDTNNRMKPGEQIFFLFNNHPQFNSLSSLTCKDCVRQDQTYVFNNNQEQIEQNPDEYENIFQQNFSFLNNSLFSQVVESKLIADIETNSFIPILQNYIVYAIVTSIVIYLLIGICLGRKHEPTGCLGKKHSISTRRGR